MMLTGISAVVMLVVALFGGGFFGLPVSVPPLPADPVIERSAPESCLLHAALRGVADPDGSSANQTEQLLANEEVQEFLRSLLGELVTMAGTAAERAGQPLPVEQFTDLLGVIATRPVSLTVERLAMQPGSPPEIDALLIVHPGEKRKSFDKALAGILQGFLGGVPPAAGDGLVRMPTGDGPTLGWGYRDDYFVFAVGDAAIERSGEIVADGAARTPAWKATLVERMPVERQSTLAYLDAAAIRELILQQVPDPMVHQMVAALGLDGLDAVGSVSGMTDEGVSSATWLGFSDTPRGIFATGAGEPLAAADFAMIPPDAIMAQVVKFDMAATLEQVLDGIGGMNPEAAAEARSGLEQFRAVVGLDLDKHLLRPLGDTWRFFMPPGGGPLFPAAALVIDVRDAKTFGKSHKALLRIARDAAAAAGQPIDFEESRYRDETIFTLRTGGEIPIPITPAWCLTDDELIITVSPQLVRTLLARSPSDETLADVPEVQEALGKGPTTLVSYMDASTLVSSLCGVYEMVTPMARSAMAQQGIEVDMPPLPPSSVIRPHARPAVSTFRHLGGDGLVTESTATIPLGPLSSGGLVGSGPATTGVLVGLLLPAVQAAREAARRSQAMNNFKQILLAMHIHADAMKNFPAQAITDEEGKPLLSWRVQILPYIEQNDLYRQFHLDEPWDSEHNLALLDKMPDVYANPSGLPASEGLTTFLVPTGEGTLFPEPGHSPRFQEVTDGTSNTIALVEVSLDRAVPWTKPDDVVIDFDDPLAAFRGVRPGGFLAGTMDGAVRFISNIIDAETLEAMFTPNGGEAVMMP
ncbi:MAG: DUF1559 domain-containing protein [Planctomycetaceae bacterium]